MNSETLGPAVRRTLLITIVLGFSGCFSLSRSQPSTHHYVLGGAVPQAAPSAPAAEGVAVGIRRLRLASYLAPTLVTVRTAPGEVSFSEYHRWAEPLGDGINRVVAGHLAARTTFRAVDVAPWAARTVYDYVVQLQVERFEGVAAGEGEEGEAHMRTDWEIVRHADGVVVARGTTEHRESGWAVGDYSALVRSLDAGVATLAGELGRTLEQFATRTTALPGAATGAAGGQ